MHITLQKPGGGTQLRGTSSEASKAINLLKGLFGAGIFMAALNARPQYAIDWHNVSGGGGASTSSVFTVTGIAGQPITGAMSGGPFTVQGGFWSLIAAIQTPGAPALRILNTATNSIVLVWPSGPTSFALQQNSDLSTTNWITAGEPIHNDGTNNTAIISPVGTRYFRLKWP